MSEEINLGNEQDINSVNEQDIILVNERDEVNGYASKEEAHRLGLLHRAFSVFLYHDNKLLLQQRAEGKYHSGGLWANTCCSHPRKDESLKDAVERRLMEETGISCETKEIFSFIYKCKFNENLFEHEIDHVFLGEYSGTFSPNPMEIKQLRWVDIDEVKKDIENNPMKYAYWFRLAVHRVLEIIEPNGK